MDFAALADWKLPDAGASISKPQSARATGEPGDPVNVGDRPLPRQRAIHHGNSALSGELQRAQDIAGRPAGAALAGQHRYAQESNSQCGNKTIYRMRP